jgi:hypothetical protein
MAFSLFAACNNDQGRNRNDRYDNNRDNRNDNNRNDRNDNNRDNRNDNNRDNRNDNNRNDNNYNRNDRNTTGRWSQTEEDNFLSTCENTATPNVVEARAKDYCTCMLGKIEKLYATYAEADKTMTKAEMQPLADECNGKQ